MPIYFACDPNSPETQYLQAKYRAERNTILQLAKRDNLFSLMLLALAKH